MVLLNSLCHKVQALRRDPAARQAQPQRPGDQPGDANGIQVGINGVEVAKIGDKYYCYVMTNYAYDALYCFDVTNPSKPVLNTDFGTNGYINFSDDQCPVRTADSMLDDGYYLAVDTDGVVWLTAKLKSGKKALMKIAPDGASCVASYELENPYSVCHAGKYILVGNKNGQTIKVYNDDDMTEIATLKYEETYGTCITRIQVVDDILFIADGQENNESLANAILVAGLTPDAQAKIDSMAKKLAEGEATETSTDKETVTGEDSSDDTATSTATETQTTVDTASQPAASNSQSDVASATTTGAGEEKKSGCASVVSASVVGVAALILAGVGVTLRKKD